MDAERFDQFSRAISVAPSRRRLLARLSGDLLAVLPLGIGGNDAAARKQRRKKKKKCKGSKKKKCGKKCIPKTNCCTDANCGECEHCQNGTCVPGCQSGQICQGGQCSCTASSCADGCCDGATCLADSKACDGECIPVGDCCTDADCGSGGATCQNGACLCPAGERDCQGACIPDGDCCTNSDCGSGAACIDGACLCLNGFKTCSDLCIPDEDCCTDDDCPNVATCQEGVCVCPVDGQVACAESCVNLSTNGGNCGSCGVACATDHSCVNGACTCVGGADCPEECFCGRRLEGGFACLRGGGQSPQCDGDGDCPLGSFCLSVGFCSKPCLP